MFIIVGGSEALAPPQSHVTRAGMGFDFRGGYISGSSVKGRCHMDSEWLLECVALSAAGGWEAE